MFLEIFADFSFFFLIQTRRLSSLFGSAAQERSDLVPMPLQRCLGFMLRVIVVLKGGTVVPFAGHMHS